jgi:peptide/nickel transport system permease protein
MLTFVVRRLLALVPLMVVVSFLVFSLVVFLPGDPATSIAGGADATPEQVEKVRRELGFDDPTVVQYWHWLEGVLQLDLGESLYNDRSVSGEIGRRFPVTFSVAIGAIVVSLVLGVGAGILAGTRPGRLTDRAVTVGTSLGLAVPSFWLALMLVIVFAVNLQWLDAIGYTRFSDSPTEWAKHLVMPWIALGVGAAATVARQVRGALVDVLDQDYIRTARSKGLAGRVVIGKHALKNAALPALTVLGIQFSYLLGGTVIVESIFSIPGLGQYVTNAITGRDLPVIQGVVLTMAVVFVVMNLLVDVLYAVVNPKVRLG